MKIIDIHSAITIKQLHTILCQKLNPLFKRQRQQDIVFIIEDKGAFVEISQPDIYDGFLFRIQIKGTQLQITRSEHYVDDVNSLTIESILNSLFDDLSGDLEVAMVQEG